MTVVVHAVTGVQRHLNSQRCSFHVHNLKAAPRLFCKHNLLLEFVHEGLNVGTLLLIRNQNSLRRCGDNDIMQPHGQHRNIHLIDDVDTETLVVQFALTDNVFFHCLGQCVPCAEILPHTGKTNDLDLRLMLHHRIVKGDFFQCIVLIKQVLIVGKIHQLMSLVHHIAQLISKHTTVPKCALRNVLLCHIGRLFFEGLDCSHMIRTFRDDIPVLFAGIGRFDAHQHKIGFAFIRLL